jgi:hypothetical protein
MAPSSISFDTLLAIDIGETNTRAILFDVVEGSYRFIASGSAPTTIGLPFMNVSEGVRHAMDDLTRISGRRLVGSNERLIMPASGDGAGADAMVIVMSGGPPLSVLITGLLEDVSVESARRLASTTYTKIVDTFSLNDRRKTEARLDAVLELQPDLILVAGGTDGGAGQSTLRMLEPLRLACNLLPAEIRPQILYAGNEELGSRIKEMFSSLTHVELAPNIRPELEQEQIDAAQVYMARAYRNVGLRKLPGLQELDSWAGGSLMPRASAFGRVIRFLSLDDSSKGVLGVDMGVSAASIGYALDGQGHLGVYQEYGLGRCKSLFSSQSQLARLMQWLPFDLPEDRVRDYIYNKEIYPGSVPQTSEELALDQALARHLLRLAAHRLTNELHGGRGRASSQLLLPPVEPIIASGNILTGAGNLGQSLLMVLDAIQPTGITTVILDKNNLAASLGAASAVNSTLAVQVLDSGTFTNLGAVISPVSSAKPGTPVLRVQMTFKDSEEEIKLDVKQGSLEVLPLAPGQTASLYLKPFHRADIGMGPGKGMILKRVVGGALGVVIDARGRPLRLLDDPVRRQELLRKWMWTLGS